MSTRAVNSVPQRTFRLVTLGRLTLIQPDGAPEVSLSRRRRKLALLAVLSLAGRPIARDALLEMFWGDQDEDRARHSLSDALSHLRRVLGRTAITMHHADVALAEDAPLAVDALELAKAAAANEHARVAALYGGEFLEQAYAANSTRYEHWVERERDRLERLFVGACAHECNALSRRGRWDECAALAARWLDVAPLSGDAAVAMVGSLAAPGTRDAFGRAIAAYERLVARLAKEFAASPDAKVKRLADDIAARIGQAVASPAPIDQVPPSAQNRPSAQNSTMRQPSVPPAPAAAPDRTAVPAAVVQPELANAAASRVGARSAAAILIVLGAVTMLVAWAVVYARPRGAHVVSNLDAIAVLPFRVAAADSSLGYLREGMVDLLDAKFTGEVGPRAVDPRALLSAWRRAAASSAEDLSAESALQVARELGAGRVLLGNVVGTPQHLVLNASVLAVSGRPVREQVSVDGAADSLPVLIDRLVAGLLARQAGEKERRLADLTSTSLPALKAYLAGKVAYRGGRIADATEHYRRALDLDRSFALAELGLAAVGEWTAGRQLQHSRERAAAIRDRLSPRDADLFTAYVGTPYPALRSGAQEIADWERAVRAAPDSPESWYELGDRFFHVGWALGVSDAERKAAAAFSQALELDSALSLPLAHLIELAARRHDANGVRRLATLYLARDSSAATADYLRWRVAAALRDTKMLAAVRARIPVMRVASLERILGMEQLEGDSLAFADAVAAELMGRAITTHERLLAYTAAHQLALNRGQRATALETLRLIREIEPAPTGFFYGARGADQLAVTDALFGDGDSTAAISAAHALERRASAPTSSDAAVRARQYTDLCTLELWRLARGSGAATAETIARLRHAHAAADEATLDEWSTAVCVPMLDALSRMASKRSGAREAVDRLDSLMATWPAAYGAEFGNLVVAQLREAQGDQPRALAAVRRRAIYWVPGPRYLSTFVRAEERLAALTGDDEGASRSRQRYAILRGNRNE
jgi:DNA-binding SARP family transcriptional activator/tetratricopeptide (TPR) repeat protein